MEVSQDDANVVHGTDRYNTEDLPWPHPTPACSRILFDSYITAACPVT